MDHFNNRKDVLLTLADLDEELMRFKLPYPLEFIIFGGTAFLLRTDFRGTVDIDAIFNFQTDNKELRKLLLKYKVNQSMRSVMEVPPFEDFYPRCERLNLPFKNLRVLLPSKEDLVLSKLFASRGSNRDDLDLINSDLIDQCDLDILREMYYDYKKDILFPSIRYSELDDILERRRIKKRKG